MTWLDYAPEDLVEDPAFIKLKGEAALLFVLLVHRSMRHGHLSDDPALYRSLWGSKIKRFDRAWNDVVSVLIRDDDGLFFFDFIDDMRERCETHSASERERKRRQRAAERERAMSRGRPADVTRPSRGCHGVSDVRTDERTDERTNPPAAAPPADKPRGARKPPTGPVADTIRHWESEWSRTRLGTRCTIDTSAGVAAAWMVKQSGGAEDARRRITAMLEDGDSWIAQNATLRLLRSKWDRYAVTILPRSTRVGAPGSGTGMDAVRSFLSGNGAHA